MIQDLSMSLTLQLAKKFGGINAKVFYEQEQKFLQTSNFGFVLLMLELVRILLMENLFLPMNDYFKN